MNVLKISLLCFEICEHYSLFMRKPSRDLLSNQKTFLIVNYFSGKTIRKIINPCVTFKKVQGKVLRPPPTPSFTEYRVCSEFPFQITGFGFAGPALVRGIF